MNESSADPDPKPNPKPPVAPASRDADVSNYDLQSRIISGILVIVVIAIVGLLYALQPSNSQGFGLFTTFVGTALSAYFGISATREVSRSAVNNANTQAGDARQQAGQLQEKHDQLTNKIVAARNADSFDKARSILAN